MLICIVVAASIKAIACSPFASVFQAYGLEYASGQAPFDIIFRGPVRFSAQSNDHDRCARLSVIKDAVSLVS
jgi:hypothetical protein